MATQQTRLENVLAVIGNDIKTLTNRIFHTAVTLVSSTGTITSITIQDDGTPTSGWPNRWEWFYDPAGAAAAFLVQWVNEYGELRLTPAKDNTVALRIFAKNQNADPEHTGPVFEIQDTRPNRNTMFAIDALGNITGPTGVKFYPMYVNPGSLTGKPAGLVVRT